MLRDLGKGSGKRSKRIGRGKLAFGGAEAIIKTIFGKRRRARFAKWKKNRWMKAATSEGGGTERVSTEGKRQKLKELTLR